MGRSRSPSTSTSRASTTGWRSRTRRRATSTRRTTTPARSRSGLIRDAGYEPVYVGGLDQRPRARGAHGAARCDGRALPLLAARLSARSAVPWPRCAWCSSQRPLWCCCARNGRGRETGRIRGSEPQTSTPPLPRGSWRSRPPTCRTRGGRDARSGRGSSDCSGSRTGTSPAAGGSGSSSSTATRPRTWSPCSAACIARASRSGGWSGSTPTAAATTRRWRPTTPPASTAALPRLRDRSGGRSTPTAGRSTSTRSRTRTSRAAACRRRRAGRSRTGHTPGRAWPSPGACSCSRSPPAAGRGAAAGPAPGYQHFSTSGR